MSPWVPDEGCVKPCPGVTVYYDPDTDQPFYQRHWHLACWLCGGPVIGVSATAYTCVPCDYSEGPPPPVLPLIEDHLSPAETVRVRSLPSPG